MAVISADKKFGVNGHASSMKSFLRAHVEDSATLLNLAEDKDPDASRAPYDPNHPDNQWPTMMHHPEKGEMPVGTNLKGVVDIPGQPSRRAAILKANQKAVVDAQAAGYRAEPYPAPQVTVLDPKTEKVELKRRLDEQQGQITALLDQLKRLQAAPPAPAAPAA
jgi:hypothetical protein